MPREEPRGGRERLRWCFHSVVDLALDDPESERLLKLYSLDSSLASP